MSIPNSWGKVFTAKNGKPPKEVIPAQGGKSNGARNKAQQRDDEGGDTYKISARGGVGQESGAISAQAIGKGTRVVGRVDYDSNVGSQLVVSGTVNDRSFIGGVAAEPDEDGDIDVVVSGVTTDRVTGHTEIGNVRVGHVLSMAAEQSDLAEHRGLTKFRALAVLRKHVQSRIIAGTDDQKIAEYALALIKKNSVEYAEGDDGLTQSSTGESASALSALDSESSVFASYQEAEKKFFPPGMLYAYEHGVQVNDGVVQENLVHIISSTGRNDQRVKAYRRFLETPHYVCMMRDKEGSLKGFPVKVGVARPHLFGKASPVAGETVLELTSTKSGAVRNYAVRLADGELPKLRFETITGIIGSLISHEKDHDFVDHVEVYQKATKNHSQPAIDEQEILPGVTLAAKPEISLRTHATNARRAISRGSV